MRLAFSLLFFILFFTSLMLNRLENACRKSANIQKRYTYSEFVLSATKIKYEGTRMPSILCQKKVVALF
jgi:hypothetical protein